MSSQSALLIPKTHDGRVIFAIPYQKHLLVGTTDDAMELTEMEFGPTKEEVTYLLNYVNAYLDVNATPDLVLAGFGGQRPLVMAGSGDTKDLVRDHEVEVDKTSGLISILGGKWTTYRLMAKDTIDTAEKALGSKRTCTTEKIILVGSQSFDHQTPIAFQQRTGCDHEVVKHIVSKYGDRCEDIAAIMTTRPESKERLLPGMPFTYAELQYVLESEMACTIKDVIARRWGVQLADWKQTRALIKPVADVMAEFLHWADGDKDNYIKEYYKVLDRLENEMGHR
jgi:glycerol-3-phosphate dehydrogenase